MKKYSIILLNVLFLMHISCAQEPVSVVPYPKMVKLTGNKLVLKKGFKVTYADEKLSEAAELLVKDLYTLTGLSAVVKQNEGVIILNLNSNLVEEEYGIKISRKDVRISGGSYNSVCMGVTTLLQMIKVENQKFTLPVGEIEDLPSSEYRGVMLDVARQWHDIETVKQVVEMCRWYKVRYMQIHLTDDQSFTFPSTTYPQLATKGRQYTLEELKDLVEFARVRGVVIIPEFDAPGHTQAMRKTMPELFGESGLGVVNMADERIYEALGTIMKEMMNVFYTSPYFHIGADEAWLGKFEKTNDCKSYIKKMGFDNAHDIYLNFIVRMHNIVKSEGKKTLVWESFSGTGSNKVQIPKDMIVFAWETLYQRPESLIENGYQVINASWKPAYITPGKRWSPEYIYKWNIHRWENHWNITPAYHNPIQLDKATPVFGGQMCSWEMSENQQITSLQPRVPAISEVFWNGLDRNPYSDYRKRYVHTNQQYNQLIFPVEITKEGFTEPNYEGLYYNRENRFSDKASVTLKSLLPNTKITYTTDGKMPTAKSAKCPSTIKLEKNMNAKFAVFNAKNELIGYKTVDYEVNAIDVNVSGNMLSLRDTNIYRNRVEFIDEVLLSFNSLKYDGIIKYTVDKDDEQTYTDPIAINRSQVVNAICYFDGKKYGMPYKCTFTKKEYNKNILTDQTVSASYSHPGYEPKYAVDGFVDGDKFWDGAPFPQWLSTELDQVQEIKEFQLFTYWKSKRYYQYTIDVSMDGENWTTVVDASKNEKLSTKDGFTHKIKPVKCRFVKVNMLKNSANHGVHIVELRAF